MVGESGRHVQLYLAHTTADFVFHTLLQAFQLVLEKCQVLKLGQRILEQEISRLQQVNAAPFSAQVYQRLGGWGCEHEKSLLTKTS